MEGFGQRNWCSCLKMKRVVTKKEVKMVLPKSKIAAFLSMFLLIALWFVDSTLPQNAKLIARWPLDEKSGDIVHDVIGGNDGTFAVGGFEWVAGKFDGGLKFDGATTHVEIPRNPALESADSVTLMLWVKFDSTAGRQEIVTYGDSYFISLNAGVFRAWIHQGGWPNADGVTAPEVGEWYFVAMTYDGADIKIYVDGVLEGTTASPGKIDYLDIIMRFGKHHAENWVLNGILDEVEVWDKAMTEEEIMAVFLSPYASTAVSPEGRLTVKWGQLRLH